MLIVPLEPARAEIIVVNSRFIASLSPVDTVEAAREYVASIKREFHDATHNVPAFIIGGGNAVTEFCSDDGEPSGTSGRPLLAVLKGSGLGNVAIVVTRYFGGALLGTGGLVKAYSEAGRAVLSGLKRAALVPSKRAEYSVPYHCFERARQAAEEHGVVAIKEEFAELVAIEADIPADAMEAFTRRIADIGSGSIAIRVIHEGTMSLPL